MNNIRSTFANILMRFGLLMLAVFLCWFLFRVWNDEVAALKTQAELNMINAVRDIEGETFNKLIFNTSDTFAQEINLKSTTQHKQQIILKANEEILPVSDNIIGISPDSFQRVMVFSEATRQNIWTDMEPNDSNNINIEVRNPSSEPSGALSIIMTINKAKVRDSLNTMNADTSLVYNRLYEGLKKYFSKTGLPVDFYIVRQPIQNPRPDAAFTSYLDLGSRNRYDIYFSNYTFWVLGKMLPEILLSLLLFGVIALAFFLIDKNLKRQERLTEIKNEFIRNITHELKTPIATVSVAIEALQNFGAMADPVRAREYLEISHTELGRLSLLVDRVLKMALFEEENHLLKRESLDIRLLLEEVMATMRLQFEKYKANVSLRIPDGVYQVQGDRLHLTNVIYNLLDNALKYSKEQPDIQVIMRSDGNRLDLLVQDHGIGIPESYLPRIFDKFFRVPTGDIHNVKGHGLGLSYVRGVVQQHGGNIAVQSKEGEGTSFTIQLPLQA